MFKKTSHILLTLSALFVLSTLPGLAQEIDLPQVFSLNAAEQGNYKGLLPWNGSGIDPSEINAVNLENRIRARMRIPLRYRYGERLPASSLENPWQKKSVIK